MSGWPVSLPPFRAEYHSRRGSTEKGATISNVMFNGDKRKFLWMLLTLKEIPYYPDKEKGCAAFVTSTISNVKSSDRTASLWIKRSRGAGPCRFVVSRGGWHNSGERTKKCTRPLKKEWAESALQTPLMLQHVEKWTIVREYFLTFFLTNVMY